MIYFNDIIACDNHLNVPPAEIISCQLQKMSVTYLQLKTSFLDNEMFGEILKISGFNFISIQWRWESMFP